MKQKLITFIALLICSKLYGQTLDDSTLKAIMKGNEYLVSLSDSMNFSAEIKPYYKSIINYINETKTNKSDWYLLTPTFQEKKKSILVSIYHVDGFRYILEANRIAHKKGDEVLGSAGIGNASGRDGELEIDKKTKKVIKFRFEE